MSAKNRGLSYSAGAEAVPTTDVEQYRTLPMKEWTKKDVKVWLTRLDLKEYYRAFTKNGVYGERLVGLTREDLHAMGISKVGHVKKLVCAIRDSATLHEGYAPPTSCHSSPITTVVSSPSSSTSTSPRSSLSSSTSKFFSRRNSLGQQEVEPTPSFFQSLSRFALPLSRNSSAPATVTTPHLPPSTGASLAPQPSASQQAHQAAQQPSTRRADDTKTATLHARPHRRGSVASAPDVVDRFFDFASSDDESGSDTPPKFFTPVMSAETNAIPEHSEQTYARLYPSAFVWVKLVYEDDVTIVRFKRKGLSLKKLKREVLRTYNRELRLKYADCEGDAINLKSNEFLEYALADWQRHFDSNQRLLRIEAINGV